MLAPHDFFNICRKQGISFFTGVPDSLLQDLCAFLTERLPSNEHVIAANEGGAIGLAAGHYLATGKPALIYLQNSGQGNAINPLLSLSDPEVYGIPMLLLVGWRGEPGIKDEPQHLKQGRVTMALFTSMEIPCQILETDNQASVGQITKMLELARREKRPVALIVRKGTFKKHVKREDEQNQNPLTREQAIACVASLSPPNAVIIASTGHISRELYEYRERECQDHSRDFLTVGSMGHASQIALGVALADPTRIVYCFDGDGALLMHLGAMPLIGQSRCHNLRHILLNNGVYGSVGGQATGALNLDFVKIAKACGYAFAVRATSSLGLKKQLITMNKVKGPSFLEIRVSRLFRLDLGRPGLTPAENKEGFMTFLRKQLSIDT